MEAQARTGFDPALPVDETSNRIAFRFNNVGKTACLNAFEAAGLTPVVGGL
jgi:hypothetical protein